MAAAQVYPSLDASIEACFPTRYEPIQAPLSHKEITIRNRLRRRESPTPWPVYELYVRHPHVPNFFLLPTYYEKSFPVVHHPLPSWAQPAHLPPCQCHRGYPHPSPSPQQLPQAPSPHHSRGQQSVHEMTPMTNRSITRSKRKYQELFNAEQFLQDREELSVFLDFDNI